VKFTWSLMCDMHHLVFRSTWFSWFQLFSRPPKFQFVIWFIELCGFQVNKSFRSNEYRQSCEVSTITEIWHLMWFSTFEIYNLHVSMALLCIWDSRFKSRKCNIIFFHDVNVIGMEPLLVKPSCSMRMIPKMHPKTCPMDQYYCPLAIVQLVATTNHGVMHFRTKCPRMNITRMHTVSHHLMCHSTNSQSITWAMNCSYYLPVGSLSLTSSAPDRWCSGLCKKLGKKRGQ
jgi:hypothetical protein